MAKILIIDDDSDIVLATKLCLQSVGHEVFDADSGEKGLQLLPQIKPDLLILDVMMGTTTEGFQVALKLRNPDPTSPLAMYRHIPIMMITAIHTTTDLRFAPEQDYLPVDAFIDKPIEPDSLIKKVDALLSKARVA